MGSKPPQESLATLGAIDAATLHPEPGVYPSVPHFVYHQWRCISNSRLGLLDRSPLHLKWALEHDDYDSAALLLGRATHSATLEPDDFDARYSRPGPCVQVLKSGKNAGAQCPNGGKRYHLEVGWLCGQHQGGLDGPWDDSRTVLPVEDYDAACAIRDNLLAHPSAGTLLRADGYAELSVVWRDPRTGLRCKARFDKYAPRYDGGVIADIKTTGDASLQAFERVVFNRGYFRKAAFYMAGAKAVGLPVQHFVLLAAENVGPFAVAGYRLTEGAVSAGEEVLAAQLDSYKACVDSGEWPGYPAHIQDIAIPAWGYHVIDERLGNGP